MGYGLLALPLITEYYGQFFWTCEDKEKIIEVTRTWGIRW